MSMNLVDAKTDHPIKRSPEIKGRFELHRLTREELGVWKRIWLLNVPCAKSRIQ